eukprot:CAMPEP_0206401246 /NCGR_PEP_ID=MMETSP0294-20121207/26141_1 /ASSEMBLY_ACC=CAM_ASM_000327 /TAXON_ID=39354 /ORGANISM="Heterosigma akashiwo, Strain CCMP2393" /LENGTH=31 /DNA_ID= /DNA_START= /DNA_END= /DNA_ORIENTATION=
MRSLISCRDTPIMGSKAGQGRGLGGGGGGGG